MGRYEKPYAVKGCRLMQAQSKHLKIYVTDKNIGTSKTDNDEGTLFPNESVGTKKNKPIYVSESSGMTKENSIMELEE